MGSELEVLLINWTGKQFIEWKGIECVMNESLVVGTWGDVVMESCTTGQSVLVGKRLGACYNSNVLGTLPYTTRHGLNKGKKALTPDNHRHIAQVNTDATFWSAFWCGCHTHSKTPVWKQYMFGGEPRWVRFFFPFFSFLWNSFIEWKADRRAPKHMRQLTTWWVFCRVERKFHSRESPASSFGFGYLGPGELNFDLGMHVCDFEEVVSRMVPLVLGIHGPF